MKKAFAAFVALLLLCLLAGVGQARMLPSPIDESKVRPEITHGFVEELLQECKEESDTYKVLTRYGFNRSEWLTIERYLQDNLRNPHLSTAGGDGRARDLFFYIIKDLLSDLKYSLPVKVTFIKDDSQCSNSTTDLIVKFPDEHIERIYTEFSRTLFDPRIGAVYDIPEGTELILYIGQWETSDKWRCAAKVMLPEKAGSDLSKLSDEYYLSTPALTELQTNRLRQQMLQAEKIHILPHQ